MSRTTSSQVCDHSGFVTADDAASSIDDAIFEILPENIPNTIITKAPEERFRLGLWTVIALVVNRTIGTGIFNSPTSIMKGTHSVGITLLFWLAGAIVTIAGTHLVIEFGLSIPRYTLDGRDQAIPRSGGILNYVSIERGHNNAQILTTSSCNMCTHDHPIVPVPCSSSRASLAPHILYLVTWQVIASFLASDVLKPQDWTALSTMGPFEESRSESLHSHVWFIRSPEGAVSGLGICSPLSKC